MLIKLIFALSFSLFGFANGVLAQESKVASAVHTLHKINSRALDEERNILVRVPANYGQTSERYPVIYMTDAHPPQNAMMAGLVEQQAWGGMIPEMIVVGIQNTNRTRDLTPTHTDGTSGGSDKFLTFIETEVIPLVEKNYRTQPFRVFAGHSLGGLFGVYALVERPEIFNAYIVASPVLGWDREFVIKRADEAFKQKKSWKKTLFVAVADEADLADGFNSFKDLLKKSGPKGIEYEFKQFPDDSHASVVLPAYYAGLRKIFAGWPPPARANVPELESHFRRLSERFGYPIVIPEALLNQIGYQFLRAKNFAEAVDAFKKNVDIYPNSANCYDSLAEAYEKSGSLKSARDNYEKAYRLAEAQGDQQLATSSRANFERISQKLK